MPKLNFKELFRLLLPIVIPVLACFLVRKVSYLFPIFICIIGIFYINHLLKIELKKSPSY